MDPALPYGVDREGHVVVRVGDRALDLVAATGLDVGPDIWGSGSLNAFFREGPDAWFTTRRELLATVHRQPTRALRALSEVSLVLPFEVGDYTDFYASREHATAMGRLLRPGDEDPLPAAWLHLPIGYHGRAGTVVVSGSPIPRPFGLVASPDGGPVYGPTARLDVEVELGFVVGQGVERGRRLRAADAERHLFGMVVVNDWSARDIQAFEYRPLGPFLGKSFATSISPWVVPLAALDRCRVEGPAQDPPPSGYLKVAEPRGLDVELTLAVNGVLVSRIPARHLYWSMAQQLAHLTANGAGCRAGDLFASGTISGPEPGMAGSLMELFEAQRWLEDGDTVDIAATAGRGELDLGVVSGTVVPWDPEDSEGR